MLTILVLQTFILVQQSTMISIQFNGGWQSQKFRQVLLFSSLFPNIMAFSRDHCLCIICPKYASLSFLSLARTLDWFILWPICLFTWFCLVFLKVLSNNKVLKDQYFFFVLFLQNPTFLTIECQRKNLLHDFNICRYHLDIWISFLRSSLLPYNKIST